MTVYMLADNSWTPVYHSADKSKVERKANQGRAMGFKVKVV